MSHIYQSKHPAQKQVGEDNILKYAKSINIPILVNIAMRSNLPNWSNHQKPLLSANYSKHAKYNNCVQYLTILQNTQICQTT